MNTNSYLIPTSFTLFGFDPRQITCSELLKRYAITASLISVHNACLMCFQDIIWFMWTIYGSRTHVLLPLLHPCMFLGAHRSLATHGWYVRLYIYICVCQLHQSTLQHTIIVHFKKKRKMRHEITAKPLCTSNKELNSILQ